MTTLDMTLDLLKQSCRTYASDDSLNYANRYNIKKFSSYQIDDTGNIIEESQMFDRFVQKVNSQTEDNFDPAFKIFFETMKKY